MPFAVVQFFVRLLHVFVLLMCLYTFQQAEASSKMYGPPTPVGFAKEASGATLNGIKSFQFWKNERVSQAKAQIDVLNGRILKKRATALPSLVKTKDRQLEALYEQLKIEQENLEFASNLSISDYLVSYLIQQKNMKSAFQAAAAQLSDEEVAQLIEAYAQRVKQAHSKSISTTAELLSDRAF